MIRSDRGGRSFSTPLFTPTPFFLILFSAAISATLFVWDYKRSNILSSFERSLTTFRTPLTIPVLAISTDESVLIPRASVNCSFRSLKTPAGLLRLEAQLNKITGPDLILVTERYSDAEEIADIILSFRHTRLENLYLSGSFLSWDTQKLPKRPHVDQCSS